MKKLSLLPLIIIVFASEIFAQHTFSIVAVDPVTGEVGSAGASCIANSYIISDVHPGYGVIHTQAYWISSNQVYAGGLMDAGIPPWDIIDSLVDNDVQNNPGIRQYGVIDLGDGLSGVRKSGWTGNGCTAYANHIVGANYVIQGNILLGPEILDSMEANFLSTQGTLACKLMAAMQGANVIGADTRCIDDGTSSLSSFIKVARPSDTTGTFYLEIEIGSVPAGVEPIDTLQTRFDEWGGCAMGTSVEEIEKDFVSVFPNPADQWAVFSVQLANKENAELKVFNSLGEEIYQAVFSSANYTLATANWQPGIYFYRIILQNGKMAVGKLVVE